jgi:CheY-like chemotaxis protein
MTNGNEPSTWKVVIVDDNADNLGVASQLLSFLGAEVHAAQSGPEGLEILENLQPTFILLDLTMPGMDGWDVLKVIRENPKNATTVVIALTGHAMEGELERIKAAGFTGYITKPYMMATFLGRIKDILAGSTAQNGSPE